MLAYCALQNLVHNGGICMEVWYEVSCVELFEGVATPTLFDQSNKNGAFCCARLTVSTGSVKACLP